jgi:hypothetical protein
MNKNPDKHQPFRKPWRWYWRLLFSVGQLVVTALIGFLCFEVDFVYSGETFFASIIANIMFYYNYALKTGYIQSVLLFLQMILYTFFFLLIVYIVILADVKISDLQAHTNFKIIFFVPIAVWLLTLLSVEVSYWFSVLLRKEVNSNEM